MGIWGYLEDVSALSHSVPWSGSSKSSQQISWLFPTRWGSFALSLLSINTIQEPTTPMLSQTLKRFLIPQTLCTFSVILERFHGSLQFAAMLLDTAGISGKGVQQSRLCFCPPQILGQFLGWTWNCKNTHGSPHENPFFLKKMKCLL